jgi:hypothetical protein
VSARIFVNLLRTSQSVVCELHFGNEPENWIPERNTIRIKNELEINEIVLNIFPNMLMGKILQ